MTKLKVLLLLLICTELKSQLSGTVQVPGTYTSIASVISALNLQGVSGPLLVSVSAGYTETVPSGGYSMTISGTATAQIVFKKAGVGFNPCVYAYAGNGTPGSASQDGIWRFIGSDYITVDGIDLVDTNSVSPKTMEFGFGFFKANGLDGCQNNTIKNCHIRLNPLNNSSGSGGAGDGSKAINVVNATSVAQTTSLTVYSPAGSNSNNHFYSNVFQGCNVGVYLYGFPDTSPYNNVDSGNDIGGNSLLTGNKILDFGGGTLGNPAIGIRTFAQYDCNISYNFVLNNTGASVNHTSVLKGISIAQAAGANVTVSHNTITLYGGATNNPLTAIENNAGASGVSNTVSVSDNHISNCTYSTSLSGQFYGIYNTASAAKLMVERNNFENNVTNAISGSTYLIYNTGNVSGFISISSNTLGFAFDAVNSYTGTLYGIYNNGGALTASLTISDNYFSKFMYMNSAGTGALYFIYNAIDFNQLVIDNNRWFSLHLNHTGPEYFMYNTSSTQANLRVCDNTVAGVKRIGTSGNIYIYYAAANSAGTAVHTLSNNVISNIQSVVSGSGNFYGIYNAEGNAAPYPKKHIHDNVLRNIYVNGTGNCYGIYCTGAGDAGSASGSSIFNNKVINLGFADAVYGMYVSGAGSASYAVTVHSNTITGLYSSGNNSSVYGSYIGNTNAGISYSRNRISDLAALGASGTVYGIYGTTTSTSTIFNNLIGNLAAPVSNGNNKVNGIYLNAGSSYNILYNTVLLNAVSTATSFGSNALYASSTPSIILRNNILVNNSTPVGNGVVAAYRRSSGNLTTYLAGSDNNLFYAGIPTSSTVVFYNGTTSYQTLTAYKTAMSTRDMASVTQNPAFLSLLAGSTYFLHLDASVTNLAESSASNTTNYIVDYDMQPRYGNSGYSGSGTLPDIGADEFETNGNPCSALVSPSITGSTASVCAGESVTLDAVSFSPGSGINYQWKVASQSAGPYVNVSGGTGSSSIEYSTGSLSSGTLYYILESVCTTNSLSATSNEFSVTVHSIPSATAQVASTIVCAGQPILLSALSSASLYFNWEGPNAYYSSLQNPTITSTHSSGSGIYSLTVLANGCSSPVSTIALSVSEVTMSVSASSSFLCSGAVATITAFGNGSAYWWNTGSSAPTITVSPALTTVYTVSLTNSVSCVATKTISVEVVIPSIQAPGAVTCQTPSLVSVSAIAFSPATVSWFSALTNTSVLATGPIYTINVMSDTTIYAQAFDSASGCISAKIPVSVTVSSFPTLTVVASQSSVCPGKSTSITVSGANTYTWIALGSGAMKIVSPTVTTTYTVNGSNSFGCASQSTISIHTFSLPLISVSQSSAFVCPSRSVALNASGAQSYTWSTGTIASSATVYPPINSTYTVYGSSSESCISSKTIAITTLSVPVINVNASRDSICPGEPVNMFANGAISYTWLPGSISGSSYSVSPTVSSVFNVIGLSVNGCTNIAFAFIHVDPCTSLTENADNISIQTFPNPVNNKLYIQFNNGSFEEISLELIDQLGILMLSSVLRADESVKTIDLQLFPPGYYYLKLKTDGRTIFKSILIKD